MDTERLKETVSQLGILLFSWDAFIDVNDASAVTQMALANRRDLTLEIYRNLTK